MLGLLLFIVALVTSVSLITLVYRRRPLLPLPPVKPRFIFFPKYIGSYQRDEADVEQTIKQMGFVRNDRTGLYNRDKVRNGLRTKSIKLTIQMDRENKQVSVYSSYFGIVYDDGEIWQLTHDVIYGVDGTLLESQEKSKQEMVDLFDKEK